MLHDLGRKNDYLVIFCTIIAIFARKSVREISQNLCDMKKILFIIGSLREKSSDRMTPKQARVFGEDVLNIVSQIPRGKVTTYGHIATLAGWPSHARMVGRTLRYTPGAEKLPCHRVVNIVGRTAPGWSRQRTLLEEEGVTFKANGHVDMERHLWEPEINAE